MRVLVTGAGGLLAGAIVRELAHHAEVIALDRLALDITDADGLARVVADAAPDVVINCAAYIDVDGAEDDPQRALAVNALAVLGLSRAAGASGAALVHYSTDFVFDGEADRPYREEDEPNPRGVYASSKLLGEWLATEQANAYVMRVESLFGEAGPGARPGSLGTIVRRVREGQTVPVFVDRTVSPSYTADVAQATRRLLEGAHPPGLYHCVNTGAATWLEVAAEAARLLERPLNVQPITLESVALRAPRPRYCALSNAKLAAIGISMPTWEDALRRHVLGA
jgi:dTDP-4-dehydrorhamnose reductase